MVYRILAHHYYYQGTFYAPKDGYLGDWDGVYGYLEFDTRESALDWMKENISPKMRLCKGKATYCSDTTYYLNHGEYERPDYTIVHFKDKVVC